MSLEACDSVSLRLASWAVGETCPPSHFGNFVGVNLSSSQRKSFVPDIAQMSDNNLPQNGASALLELHRFVRIRAIRTVASRLTDPM